MAYCVYAINSAYGTAIRVSLSSISNRNSCWIGARGYYSDVLYGSALVTKNTPSTIIYTNYDASPSGTFNITAYCSDTISNAIRGTVGYDY